MNNLLIKVSFLKDRNRILITIEFSSYHCPEKFPILSRCSIKLHCIK